MTQRKKLIEVALPLDVINFESGREKSIRHGHPSTLHLWWARRPLAACRAVLFASLVDDPSARPEEFPTEAAQEVERGRLLKMIEQLVNWDNLGNEELIKAAQQEIFKSTGGNPPPVLDPFCGGGSIPLEVQRLGLEAHASDINPVAVMITKAMIEIPPKFKNLPPINPEARKKEAIGSWVGAQGLAEDVRYYGKWVRDEAQKKIGNLYPAAQLPDGGEATVIAWLWARTVKCPNPACGCDMPLLSSFVLSSKKGKESYLIPKVHGKKVSFEVSNQPPSNYENPSKGFKRGMSGIFECINCGTVTTRNYVSEQGKAKLLGAIQTAVVVEAKRGRLYFAADHAICPKNVPEIDKAGLDIEFPANPRDLWCRNFGLNTPYDLFTPRQLTALTTLGDLVKDDALEKIRKDSVKAGLIDDGIHLRDGGTGATAYGEAIITYLALSLDKLANYNSSICSWNSGRDTIRDTFARQAIPMTWDFTEVNPFSDSTGNFQSAIDWTVKALQFLPSVEVQNGQVEQRDARTASYADTQPLVFTTDPPYYDNIGYADLSDFFYVWLRRSLGRIYPDLFSTLATPKTPELIYAPYRHDGDKEKAKQFFEDGLKQAFRRTYEASNPNYPFTVFYAFKQTESDDDDLAVSTGWETMLESLIQAGFSVTGTWPMRTERSGRTVANNNNALASSIALVCRPLPANTPSITRRQFLTELNKELPTAIKNLQQGNLAPVDLQQASIGPGIAVFSRYQKVLEADGQAMTVRTALKLINQVLDDYLSDQESEFDADSRWALTWFEQHQFEEGLYGEAETLSKAKNVSIKGLVNSGILAAKGGKVHLLRREELPKDWNPQTDSRVPDWEATQHLIYSLENKGEQGAAQILAQLNGRSEIARDLAYRLYSLCDRHGWTQEATAYNSLVTSWPEIARLAQSQTSKKDTQGKLDI
jgi:putative DNA methylase